MGTDERTAPTPDDARASRADALGMGDPSRMAGAANGAVGDQSDPTRGSVLGPLAALFAAFAVLVIGNGLHSTLLAVRAGLEGVSETGVGSLMSAFYAGYAVGGVAGARIVGRVGPVRAFAGLCSVVSAIALVHVLFVSLPLWIGLRLVHGACFAVLVLIVEAWINASTPRERRGRILSFYSLTFLLGGVVSQQLLNLADPTGFALFALVSVLASLALVPITLSPVAEPRGLGGEHMGLRDLWDASPLGVAGVATSGALVAAFWGVGPAYAQGIGLSDAGLSLFMSAIIGGAVLTQWPLGWLSDRIDRRLVAIGTFVAAALASLALMLLAAPSLPVLIALAALFGATVQPSYSLCVAHVNDRAPDRVVAVAGGLILVYGVAAAMGPLAAGATMDALGPAGLWTFAGALSGAFVAFGLSRVIRSEAVPEVDKAAYAEAPRTSSAIHGLDPRGDDAEPTASRTGTGAPA